MNLQELTSTLEYVAKAHSSQRRKNANEDPYINHLIEVLRLLVWAGIEDFETLATALLHDILEDTAIDFDELYAKFGSEIADSVQLLTEDKNKPQEERRHENIKKAQILPENIKLIKAADLISNVQSIPYHWERARLAEYLRFCREYFIALELNNHYLLSEFNTACENFKYHRDKKL